MVVVLHATRQTWRQLCGGAIGHSQTMMARSWPKIRKPSRTLQQWPPKQEVSGPSPPLAHAPIGPAAAILSPHRLMPALAAGRPAPAAPALAVEASASLRRGDGCKSREDGSQAGPCRLGQIGAAIFEPGRPSSRPAATASNGRLQVPKGPCLCAATTQNLCATVLQAASAEQGHFFASVVNSTTSASTVA